MLGADGFRGIARPAAGKMQPLPILDQHPQRQSAGPRALRLFGFRGVLATRDSAFVPSPMVAAARFARPPERTQST
jgi:hypothetical protein